MVRQTTSKACVLQVLHTARRAQLSIRLDGDLDLVAPAEPPADLLDQIG
jgi:hypothetical protein